MVYISLVPLKNKKMWKINVKWSIFNLLHAEETNKMKHFMQRQQNSKYFFLAKNGDGEEN